MWLGAPASSSCLGICVHDTSHDTLSIFEMLPRPVWSNSAVQTQSRPPPGLGEVTRLWITDARLLSAGWDLTLFLSAVMRAAVWPHPSFTLAETGCGSWWDSPNIGPATLVPSEKNKVGWNPLMTAPRQMQSVCAWASLQTKASLPSGWSSTTWYAKFYRTAFWKPLLLRFSQVLLNFSA